MNKRKNGIETYSRILVMASELFAKSGFDGVSMQEIAENLKENYADLRAISDIWNQTKTSGKVKAFPFAEVLN